MELFFEAILVLFVGQEAAFGVFLGLLLIAGLWGIFKKCGITPWHALIPCYRSYELSRAANSEMEGRVLFVADVTMTVLNVASLFIPDESTLSVMQMILILVM